MYIWYNFYMNTAKNKKDNLYKYANKLIVIGSAWLIGWFAIISIVEADTSSGYNLIFRLPILLASFGVAWGFGLKTKDKLGIFTVTLFLGVLLTYLFSIPFETYKGFILIFINRSIF